MKRYNRLLALMLCIAMCLTLCSCKELDDLRAQHAIWLENGNVVWNGVEYTALPEMPYGNMYLGSTYQGPLYVTEKDVPVLLSKRIGDRFGVYWDGKLLDGFSIHYYDEHAESISSDGVIYYCPVDMYDTVLSEIVAADAGDPIITQYYFDCLKATAGREMAEYVLTEEQTAAIQSVLQTVDPVPSDRDETLSVEMLLYGCSEQRLCRIPFINLQETQDGDYYLLPYYDSYYPELRYPIPETYRELLSPLFDIYRIHWLGLTELPTVFVE